MAIEQIGNLERYPHALRPGLIVEAGQSCRDRRRSLALTVARSLNVRSLAGSSPTDARAALPLALEAKADAGTGSTDVEADLVTRLPAARRRSHCRRAGRASAALREAAHRPAGARSATGRRRCCPGLLDGAGFNGFGVADAAAPGGQEKDRVVFHSARSARSKLTGRVSIESRLPAASRTKRSGNACSIAGVAAGRRIDRIVQGAFDIVGVDAQAAVGEGREGDARGQAVLAVLGEIRVAARDRGDQYRGTGAIVEHRHVRDADGRADQLVDGRSAFLVGDRQRELHCLERVPAGAVTDRFEYAILGDAGCGGGDVRAQIRRSRGRTSARRLVSGRIMRTPAGLGILRAPRS